VALIDYDPASPGGSGSSSTSLSSTKLSNNQVPNQDDWVTDGWLEEDGDHCHDFEEPVESDPLPVAVNFQHVRD
jgi:hypothetical protein